MADMPTQHTGHYYAHFLAELARKRGTERYLEVGVCTGTCITGMNVKFALGVDPNFVIDCNVAKDKVALSLVQMGSDAFFASPEMKGLLGGPPELSFLDGMHTFEYLLRDFMNTERFGTRRSLIAMHDCLPLDEIMTIRHIGEWQQRMPGTAYQGWWTGDVWKLIPILQKYRPDVRVYCIDCAPTGLVLITNLDPSSSVLEDRYLDIVDEFSNVPNSKEQIAEMYSSIKIYHSAPFLQDFDHSLYFRP